MTEHERGTDRGRGPGLAQVAGRDRLRGGDLHPGLQVVVTDALEREGLLEGGSRPARTAWSTRPSMIPPGRCCWP